MKKLAILAIAALAVLTAACEQNNAENKDKEVVEDQQAVYAGSQPIPFFNFSQVRDTLIQIYNQIVPESRSTYSVFFTNDGTPVWSCPSRGFPLAADTQLTNPLKNWGGQGAAIEQAEPSGVYTSKNTNATWVLCVRDNGDVVPVYSEPMVLTFPYPVAVENGEIREIAGSESSLKVDLKDE